MAESTQLDKVYEPREVQQAMYALWEQNSAFHADPNEKGRDERFTVMIPLPNVTGTLHLGHAINNSLQDIVTRWHRMHGFASLYQPGTDHAGIATQAVVERRLFEEEGKTRHDLGREELVRRIWTWKDQYERRILEQLKTMGCSCDWRRVRFTLDDRYSTSVFETFFRWFSAGLIYRGERLVNWDSHLRTAVADDEVYHKTVKGKFWHFRYPIENPPPDGPAHLGFATTRPETMLGDTALAVNPDDDRYRSLIGRTALIPLFDPPRRIPVIADEWADPEKGTGCVKITPAHDPNDYQVGLRHGLEMINIMTPDRRVNERGGAFADLSFDEARKRIVEKMESLELLDNVETISVDQPHSDRSKTPIEPYLSPQWFVRMGDVDGGIKLADGSNVSGLAQAAMDAVQNGRVRILPERYKKTYLDWLGEKRDWCISRQLWWGHQIPVWSWSGDAGECQLTESFITRLQTDANVCVRMYRLGDPPTEVNASEFVSGLDESSDNFQINVALRDSESQSDVVNSLANAGLTRDPDVLDTWFSSQLWPYATLGWPEQSPDLDFFYPGTVLITSRDIITLWVARMVASGLYNIGDVPFRDVYIHPKILDGRGETMSKSKGNGVDPLDIIDAYGADAMRYALADMTTETQDVRMPVDYRCPHCQSLTPQTDRNMQSKTIACKDCKKSFATRWADEATVAEHGLAGMVSDKFEIGRNFCNKLWNAARFAFLNLDGVQCANLTPAMLPVEDRWILARLSQTCRALDAELRNYRYSSAIKLLRDFFWDSLCDWYVELTKARMQDDENGAAARQILAFCLDQILRMLHPFIPFITERLWQQLNTIAPTRGLPRIADLSTGPLLINAQFPPRDGWPALDDPSILGVFETLQNATRGIREIRNRNGISPSEGVRVSINAPNEQIAALQQQSHIVQRMAGVNELHIAANTVRPKNAGTVVLGSLQVFVHDVSDDEAERKRLVKECADVDRQIAAKVSKLSNEGFVRNAKPEIVTAERQRLESLQHKRASLAQNLQLLEQ